jgi:hypothetical protein
MMPIKGSETLLEEMKKCLPIPAHFTRESSKALDQEGTHIDPDKEIEILDVFDSGDMGGIVCVINKGEEQALEKQVLIVSLTHLLIKPDHPLSDKIAAYHKKRIRRLKRYG